MLQVSYGVFKLWRLFSMNFKFLILEKIGFIIVIKADLRVALYVVFHVVWKLVEFVF